MSSFSLKLKHRIVESKSWGLRDKVEVKLMKRTAPGRAWVKTQSWNSWHLPGTFSWCHLQGSWKVTQSLHSFPVQASVTSIRIISTSSWAALFFRLLLALHFPNIAPFKVIFFWMSCSGSFISLFFFCQAFSASVIWLPLSLPFYILDYILLMSFPQQACLTIFCFFSSNSVVTKLFP